MQRVRMTATPRDVVPHPLFELILDPPGGGETRLLDWNLSNGSRPTALFEIPGDADEIERRLAEIEEIADFDVHRTDSGPVYCFLRPAPDPDSPMSQLFGALSKEGLIVVKPVRYSNGAVHATWVGEPAVLQAALDDLPDVVDVTIEAVGSMDAGPKSVLAGLSTRQREALEVALAVGYYEHPRQATHRDVAEAMDCAPSTASEHLSKAESKLVRAALATQG